MRLEKSWITDILAHIPEVGEPGICTTDLVKLTEMSFGAIKNRLVKLQRIGAVVCVGNGGLTTDGYHKSSIKMYGKIHGIELVEPQSILEVTEEMRQIVLALITRKFYTATEIAELTNITAPYIHTTLKALVQEDLVEEVGREFKKEYRACRVVNTPTSQSPWDWKHFRSEYSPKSWDPNTPSSYKPLPQGADL
jgi:DNA-binding MarR family transcriptional regulator